MRAVVSLAFFVAVAFGDLLVYSDNARNTAQFDDWSFGSSISYASTAAIYAGSTSIAVTTSAGSFGGLSLYYMGGSFTSPAQAYVEFYIQPTTAGQIAFKFSVAVPGSADSYLTQPIPLTGLTVGAWTKVQMPIPGNYPVQRFYVLDTAGVGMTFYLDEINVRTSWSSPIVAYADSSYTAQFQDWKWSTSINYEYTSSPHAGSSSMRATMTAGGAGVSFIWGSGTFTAGGTLSFYINPDTSNPTLVVRFHTGDDSHHVDLAVATSMPSGTWTQIMSTVPNDGFSYPRFSIVDINGVGYTFNLDDITISSVPISASVTRSVTPSPASQSVTPSISRSPIPGGVLGLRVSGNMLVDVNGNNVHIHGVNRAGTEYACIQGWGFIDPVGTDTIAAIQVSKTWGINAYRVPLNEDCWLGINVANAYTGAAYRTFIQNWVDKLQSQGMYVILDLHWAAPGTQQSNGQLPMADLDHAPAFWADVANTFKTNLGVIFELFNEPFPRRDLVSASDKSALWQCLRDGTSCDTAYAAAGYQVMLDAVRSTGAANVVLCGGAEWSNALDLWLTYKPNDPTGNLGAAWHSYNFNQCSNSGCWNSIIAPIAAQVPVIVTEVGQSGCAHDYIDTILPWLDAHCIHYMAWQWGPFDCSGGPALISNMDGTATNYGIGYKNHLASLNPTCVNVISRTPTPTPVSASNTPVSLSASVTPVSASISATPSLSPVSITASASPVSVTASLSPVSNSPTLVPATKVPQPSNAGQITGYYTGTQTISGNAYYAGTYGGGGACGYDLATIPSGYNPIGMGVNYWAGSAVCGMCIEYTGNGQGSGTTPVSGTFLGFVNNECAGCSGNGAYSIQINGNGIWQTTWRAVDCPTSGAIKYACQGSNPYYVKIQVRNVARPISAFAVKQNGNWVSLTRSSDGFFVGNFGQNPVSVPFDARITSLDGQIAYDTISASCFQSNNAFSGSSTAAQFTTVPSPAAGAAPVTITLTISSETALNETALVLAISQILGIDPNSIVNLVITIHISGRGASLRAMTRATLYDAALTIATDQGSSQLAASLESKLQALVAQGDPVFAQNNVNVASMKSSGGTVTNFGSGASPTSPSSSTPFPGWAIAIIVVIPIVVIVTIIIVVVACKRCKRGKKLDSESTASGTSTSDSSDSTDGSTAATATTATTATATDATAATGVTATNATAASSSAPASSASSASS